MGVVIGTVVVISVGTVVFLLIWWRIADHWIAQEKHRRFTPSKPDEDGPPPTVVHPTRPAGAETIDSSSTDHLSH